MKLKRHGSEKRELLEKPRDTRLQQQQQLESLRMAVTSQRGRGLGFVSGLHKIVNRINRVLSEVSAVRPCKYSFMRYSCWKKQLLSKTIAVIWERQWGEKNKHETYIHTVENVWNCIRCLPNLLASMWLFKSHIDSSYLASDLKLFMCIGVQTTSKIHLGKLKKDTCPNKIKPSTCCLIRGWL